MQLWEHCFLLHLEVSGKGVKKGGHWASLVAQWLRICLPMQGTRV